MAEGPTLVEQFKGFLGRFRKASPVATTPRMPLPAPRIQTPEVQVESSKVVPPPKTEVKEEETLIVPEIRNNYGNRSVFQIALNGKSGDKWEYAIRDTHSVDAHEPKGHFLRVPGSTTRENPLGQRLLFDSMDEALDFTMAENRSTSAKWNKEHPEDPTIHYDPREEKIHPHLDKDAKS